jgi:hypothetical protein
MSPDEVREDAVARSKAMGQQALHGESKVGDEIDRLLSGKR